MDSIAFPCWHAQEYNETFEKVHKRNRKGELISTAMTARKRFLKLRENMDFLPLLLSLKVDIQGANSGNKGQLVRVLSLSENDITVIGFSLGLERN